jgi:hypothetical protein
MAEAKRGGRRTAVIFAVVVVAVILIFAFISLSGMFGGSFFPFRRHYTVTLLSGSMAVNAPSYSYVQFEVPNGATDVTVTGNFVASGGMGNDIKVYIMSSTDFLNWQNGHQASAYYDSGKVTAGDLSLSLPAGQSYYLIFDNTFSIISGKTVSGTITLTYSL